MIPYSDEFSTLLERTIRPRAQAIVRLKLNGEYSDIITGKQILSVECEDEVDPLSRMLPVESVVVRVLDFTDTFNPMLPENFEKYYNSSFEMSVSFGLYDDTDAVQPGPWLIYYVNEIPEYENRVVTFKGKRLLKTLTTKFTDFPHVTLNAKILAERILGQAGVSSENYALMTSLPSYYINVVSMLPIDTCENALLTLANMTCAQLRTKYTGVISLQDEWWNNWTTQLVMKKDMLEEPSMSVIPLLRNVRVDLRYRWVSDETNDVETIGTLQGYFPANTVIKEFIEFSRNPRSDVIDKTITGGTISSFSTSRLGATVEFVANSSDKEVTIDIQSLSYGIREGCRQIEVNLNGTEDEEIDNPLQAGQNADRLAAYHGQYLGENRCTYRIVYRGDPRIEVMDIIRVELPYYGVTECLVLSTKFNLSTSFNGELIVKRLDSFRGEIVSAVANCAIAGIAVAGITTIRT